MGIRLQEVDSGNSTAAMRLIDSAIAYGEANMGTRLQLCMYAHTQAHTHTHTCKMPVCLQYPSIGPCMSSPSQGQSSEGSPHLRRAKKKNNTSNKSTCI